MSKGIIDIKKFGEIAQAATQLSLYPYAVECQNIAKNQFAGAHPVHKQWGSDLADKIRVLLQKKGNSPYSRVYVIGWEKLRDYQASRAHVIEQGNGQVWSKPGQAVYGDELYQTHTSNASADYRIPNLQVDGQGVIQNVHTIIRHRSEEWGKNAFDDAIRYIAKHINECVVGGD